MNPNVLNLQELPMLSSFLFADHPDESTISVHLRSIQKAYVDLGIQLSHTKWGDRDTTESIRMEKALRCLGYVYEDLDYIEKELQEYLSSAKAVEE